MIIKFNKSKDKIAIIAPASGSNVNGRLDINKSIADLEHLVTSIKKFGYMVTYDKLFQKSYLPYVASPKEQRVKELKNAILDDEVKIIFAFRGGYGSSEVISEMSDLRPKSQKILIGFSDITTLHFLFNQHYGFNSIHASMKPSNLHQILNILDGTRINLKLIPFNNAQNVSGKIIGGNLTIICTLIGTKLHPQFNRKILFLEDINEPSYKIHRNLMHIYNAGLFDRIESVIFGDFSGSDKYLEQAIKSFCGSYLTNIPIYRTIDIGHGKKNIPIIIGSVISINEYGDTNFLSS